MPKRSPELKGISDFAANRMAYAASVDLPLLNQEVEIGDGLYLLHTPPSIIMGRCEGRTWNYVLRFENRGVIPVGLLWGLMNVIMQNENSPV